MILYLGAFYILQWFPVELIAGHEAPLAAPFGAMAPFGGSLFGGSDPFQVGTDVVMSC